jgi:hypothetical protein
MTETQQAREARRLLAVAILEGNHPTTKQRQNIEDAADHMAYVAAETAREQAEAKLMTMVAEVGEGLRVATGKKLSDPWCCDGGNKMSNDGDICGCDGETWGERLGITSDHLAAAEAYAARLKYDGAQEALLADNIFDEFGFLDFSWWRLSNQDRRLDGMRNTAIALRKALLRDLVPHG